LTASGRKSSQTATALGLTIPETFVLHADKVIE
jgi:hypothetical protein